MSSNEENPNSITVPIGVCKVEYKEEKRVYIYVSVKCSSVELFTNLHETSMKLNNGNNAKLSGRTVIVTEPEDGTEVHDTTGEITKVKVTHPEYQCYVSKRYRENWAGYKYTHDMYFRRYLPFYSSANNYVS